MIDKLLNKITEEEIKELTARIEDFFFIEFTISELYNNDMKSLGVLKYKRIEKYLLENYEQVECGCSEIRFKKEV